MEGVNRMQFLNITTQNKTVPVGGALKIQFKMKDSSDVKVSQYGFHLQGENKWQWDPFNFKTGTMTYTSKTTSWNEARLLEFNPVYIGSVDRIPKLVIKSLDQYGFTIRFVNKEKNIDVTKTFNSGTYTVSEFIFSGHSSTNVVQMYLMGNGTGTIDFNQ